MKKTAHALVVGILTAIVWSGLPVTAHAQYGPGEYTNSQTGRTWNNPTSSFLDTAIQNNQQMTDLMVRQSVERSLLQQSLARERSDRHLYWWGAGIGLVYCALRLRRQKR